MRKTNKLMATILTLCMMISLLPTMSLTAFADTATNVYVGVVELTSTGTGDITYATVSDNVVTKVTDDSVPTDNYAKFENGTLTLHNFTYSGEGHTEDKTKAGIYSAGELTLVLEGTNSVTQTGNPVGDSHHTSVAVAGKEGITISGSGSLYAVAGKSSFSLGIRSDKGYVTVEGRSTVIAIGTETTYGISSGIWCYSDFTLKDTACLTAIGENNDCFSQGIVAKNQINIDGGTLTAKATGTNTDYRTAAINQVPTMTNYTGGYQWKTSESTPAWTASTEAAFTNNGDPNYVQIKPAEAINYDVYVGDTRVTSANANDILGDGTVSYTPASGTKGEDGYVPQTLTLNNADIEGALRVTNDSFGIYAYRDLTIKLIGGNTVTGVDAGSNGNSYGIYTIGNLKIEDDSSDSNIGGLASTGGQAEKASYGICSNSELTISGGTVTATSTSTTGIIIVAFNKAPILTSYTNSKVTASTNANGSSPVATYNENDIGTYKYIEIKPKHTHNNWQYKATGATITATCGEYGCTDTPYAETLTINAPSSLTYDGTEKPATLSDKTSLVSDLKSISVINYEIKDAEENYVNLDNESVPVSAGEYRAKISCSDKIAFVEYTIKKATPTYTTPTGLNATYGQTLADVSLPTGFTWENPSTSVGNVGDNSFTVKFTPTDTANYKVVTGITVSVKVEKATPKYETPTKLTATYGDTLSNITLPTGFTWENTAKTSVGNIGNNSFTIKYTPADTTNYKEITGISVSINVAQRPVNINWTGTDNLVFDNTLKTVTAEVSNKVGTDVINLTVTGNEETAKGEYTAEVTSIDNANYTLENGTNLTKVWSISNAANEWTTSLDITGWIFGEKANTPTASTKYGTVVFTYSDKADGAFTANVPTNAGTYYVKAEVSGTEDYSGIFNTKEFTILPKAITTEISDIESATYTGSTITPEITVKNGETSLSNTDYDVAYENNINVGTAKVKVTLNGNYSGKCEKEFTINPKQINNAITLTAPIKNSAPQTTIETDEYTASVVWSPEVTTSFASSTVYTAKIAITPKANYTTDGIAECTVSGATTVTVDEIDNKIITAVFPKTGSSGGGGSSISYYTVKFETNGGSTVNSQRIRRNDTIGKITEPQKDGYTFDGWFTDKALTKSFYATTKITSGITLYAKWTEIPVDNSKNEIILTIGQKDATVFGETKTNDVAPLIRNDRTMLPARFVAEALGATVLWDEKEQKVTITKDNITIIIYIDSDKAYVNGKEVILDSPAFIENNRTYTPLRFVAENLGATVDWSETEQKVIITKK